MKKSLDFIQNDARYKRLHDIKNLKNNWETQLFSGIFVTGLWEIKDKYKEGNLVDFYKYLDAKEFSNLKQFACKFISMFGTTLCEQTFSRMKYLKSKYRANLSDDHLQSLLLIGVTYFNPNYKGILQ